MPTLARPFALSIAVTLAVLASAAAAQAAPLPLTHAGVTVSDVPNDGVVAPGDALVITETVHNGGPSTLTGLTAVLSSQTDGVAVTQASASYPAIAANTSAANATPLRVTLDPSLACGTTLQLTLTFTNADGTAAVPFTIVTGTPGQQQSYTGNPAVIGNSIASAQHPLAAVSYAGTALVADAGIVDEVQVNIGSLTHPDISHLALSLRAPDGTTVPLVHAGRGGPGRSFTATNLVQAGASLDTGTGDYTATFQADGNLGALAGVSEQGTWELFASEPDPAEIGRINSWTLRIVPASCEPLSVAKLTATPNPVDPGAGVVLNALASGTVDPGGITRYEWDLGTGTFADGPATRTENFPRGTRTVRVRVSDANGVIGTASVNLIVSFLPNAIISLPPAPKEQTSVVLDGSGSNDPDNAGIVSHAWTVVDPDGQVRHFSGAQPQVYLAEPGAHTVTLTVTDGDGAQGESTTTLNVIATTPPSPSIVATPNPVVAGQAVTFDASGSTDDGTIVGYEWDLDGNQSYETASGTTPVATHAYPNATVMSVGVRVTDDDGRVAVKRVMLVVTAPSSGPGASPPFDPGVPDSGGSGGGGGSGGSGGSGGNAGTGGGSAGGAGAAADGLAAGLDGASIQTLKLVSRKGLGLRCSADRAATCTVSAALAPADARRLGLSRSRTKPYVLGRATVRLPKAGAAGVTVRVARRALARLKRTPRVTVVVTGQAVDRDGRHVALRRAILVRR